MRWQIYGVWASFFIALTGLCLIVWAAEPQTASLQIKALFFVAVFILVWSATTAIIFYIKNRRARSRTPGESAYDPIFYDSFLTGLFISVIFIAIILIKKVFNF